MVQLLTKSRNRRILTITIFFLFAVTITVIGTVFPLTPEQITKDNNQLTQTQQNITEMDIPNRFAAIFQNNFTICLLMFIPIVGIFIGGTALFTTGNFIQAQSLTHNASPLLVLFFLFIFPFTWLEFIAYSTAFSESFWIIRRGSQGIWRREIINLCKLILVAAGLLAAGALIESLLL
jgi:hypothetical protein